MKKIVLAIAGYICLTQTARAECVRGDASCTRLFDYIDNVTSLINQRSNCNIRQDAVHVMFGGSFEGDFVVNIDNIENRTDNATWAPANSDRFSTLLNFKYDVADQASKLLAVINTNLPAQASQCRLTGGTGTTAPGSAQLNQKVQDSVTTGGGDMDKYMARAEALGANVMLPQIEADEFNQSIKFSLPDDVDSQLALARSAPPQSTGPMPIPGGNWFDSYQNSWSAGNKYLGARIDFRAGYRLNGEALAAADARGRVINTEASVASGQASTTRVDAANRPLADGPFLRIRAVYSALGDTTEAVDERVQVSRTFTIPGYKILDSRVFFKASQQFFIGPVPVVVNEKVVGDAGYDPVAITLSPETLTSRTAFEISPYAKVSAVFEGGAGTAQASVGAGGQVFLLHSSLGINAIFEPQDDKCLYVYLKDATIFNGRGFLYEELEIPQVETVVTAVKQVCKSKYLKSICKTVESKLEQVVRWTKFRKEQSLFQWPGYPLANRHYFYNECRQ